MSRQCDESALVYKNKPVRDSTKQSPEQTIASTKRTFRLSPTPGYISMTTPSYSTSTKPTPAPAPSTPDNRKPDTMSLGLLVALVVGSIIGSGIFGMPQNMAAGAGAGAILIGWAITGVGMLMLARVYQMLALRKPELDNGVYAYARALSGEYVGFNAAWGC